MENAGVIIKFSVRGKTEVNLPPFLAGKVLAKLFKVNDSGWFMLLTSLFNSMLLIINTIN
jgi:hypothetical protein